MNRDKIGYWIIAMSWILLIVVSALLIKSCRIKYEVIPQTVQIESFTYNGETHEYVKEFSYYDKKRNISIYYNLTTIYSGNTFITEIKKHLKSR